jgi:predicted Zn-dependent protease
VLAAVLGLALGAGGWQCSTRSSLPISDEPYGPDRRDYLEFRGEHADLLEPNYLPFMTYRFREPEGEGDLLVFCRWPDEAMPLPVYIHAPEIPDRLQDEFDPREPAEYVQAVQAALGIWEYELENEVGFRRVSRAADAAIEIVLEGRAGPEPDADRRVLGRVGLRKACRAQGWAARGKRLVVRFQVPEVLLYVADDFGLLGPEQVQWIALHEIGHALGMRFHSPIPADIMYERVRDRAQVKGLSTEDANSFLTLYRLPNGTVFRRLPVAGTMARAPHHPPSGPPRLELAPHVDSRRGFSLHPPQGWVRSETSMGMVAVEGVTWDYTSSFQVIVHRYPTLEAFFQRYGEHYVSRGRIRRDETVRVDGRRARHLSIENREGDAAEEITFIESGDGRVFVVIADCPVDQIEAYRPWFAATLGSLEIWRDPHRVRAGDDAR